MNAATLNGHRVTTAHVNIPAWGCWYGEVSIDGEVEIDGAVTLKMADLTLVGTVLSGGPMKGRSTFRVVAGAGGWGRQLPRKNYVNDAGVKLATVLGDAAREAGETLAAPAASERLGPAWTRRADIASRVLELAAPGGWYVDEAGVTRIGARAPGALVGQVTRIAPIDLARGKVVIAAESIATVLPGVVVDGLAAVDVLHEISAEGGLRSTLWGLQVGSTLDSLRALLRQLDPDRDFRGVTEYRITTRSGALLNLQPVRVSTGMPDLPRVRTRPGVPGCRGDAALGSRVLVGFVDADPARPYVAAFEDPDGGGFQATTLSLLAGGSAGGEHVMTTEACILLIYNVLQTLTLVNPGPVIGLTLQPLLTPAILTAMGAQSAPAPPGLIAQTAAAAALASSMTAGTAPSNATGPLAAGLAALSTKTPNASTFFPSLGAAAVETG